VDWWNGVWIELEAQREREREQQCYRPVWEIEQAALTLDLHTL